MNFKKFKLSTDCLILLDQTLACIPFLFCLQKNAVLLNLLHYNTYVSLKKIRFMDLTPNTLNQNRVRKECWNLHIKRHRRPFLPISKLRTTTLGIQAKKLEKH